MVKSVAGTLAALALALTGDLHAQRGPGDPVADTGQQDKYLKSERYVALNGRPALRVIEFRSPNAGASALIYIHGDVPDNPKSKAMELPGGLISLLEAAALKNKITLYAIMRPGVNGSGGSNADAGRKGRVNMQWVTDVIDAIIIQDGLTDVVLVGRSGGASFVLAHAIMGREIKARCLVLASGSYHLYLKAPFYGAGRGKAENLDRQILPIRPEGISKWRDYEQTLTTIDFYEPALYLDNMKPSPRRRFILVVDRRDQRVPFESSQLLTEQLSARGEKAEYAEARTAKPPYHYTSNQAFELASRCLDRSGAHRTASPDRPPDPEAAASQ